MKLRRLAALCIAGAALAAIFAMSTGGAAGATRGACLLKGSANFSPGLKAKAAPVTYTFSGTLSSCKGAPGITGGSVTASGSGSAGCANGATTGTATITWSNGTTSTVSFSTKSALALTAVTGKITSGTFAGANSKAALVFQTSTPQLCATTGLTSASFQGPSTLGV